MFVLLWGEALIVMVGLNLFGFTGFGNTESRDPSPYYFSWESLPPPNGDPGAAKWVISEFKDY